MGTPALSVQWAHYYSYVGILHAKILYTNIEIDEK